MTNPPNPAVETQPDASVRAVSVDKSSKPAKLRNCLIYARFSPRPKKDVDNSESIETQAEYCEEYCTKRGYTVAALFSDRALSGSDEDRPALWNCIDSLQRGMILVVYKLDRLARDNFLAEYIRRQVSKAGATIESVTQDAANGDAPDQVFIRQILQAYSEYERKVIAARTSAAMQRHQKSGRRMGNPKLIPYGWMNDTTDPQRMVANPLEQQAIAAATLLRAGGLSLRKIGRELSGSGYAPRCGGTWTAQQVKALLG